MATLHAFCGKPGSGKTTLARSLATSLPAVIVCEDEWIATLGLPVRSLDDYRAASTKCRALMSVVVPQLLRLGMTVVLDFAANTVERRTWLRSLFESASADHVLHVLDASDDICLANIHRRNAEQPAGVYFGAVSDEIFRAVVPHVISPSPEEGFSIVRHG